MKNLNLKKLLAGFIACVAMCTYADEDYKKSVVEDIDIFPTFESLKAPILMPANAKLEFSKDGHFLVDGKPRYLEGTVFHQGDSMTCQIPTYGYPPSLNWLYETCQDYKDLQRIGFDTVATGVPNDWIQKYRKRFKFIPLHVNEEMFLRYGKSGLPLYVDYTAAPWSHGALRYIEGQLPTKEAFTVPGYSYHWMPYSANTPEGRELWREMWECGVTFLKKFDAKPFVYELFNEPDYDDLSDFNKNLFAKKMRGKYNKISRLNDEWGTSYADFAEIAKFKKYEENVGLFIEWIKFMEDSFADLCKYGAKIIRAADGRPDAGVCFQPIYIDGNNVNIYKTNKNLNTICTPTGGGNYFLARYLKAMADGKPIFDGETYMGHTRESFRDIILTQYMRGFNASYLFKWSRRPNDPAWKQENGGVRLAEIFPYMVLNPYSVKPNAILGLMDAKKAIMEVDEIFTPRERGIKSDVAVIYSYPTNRLQRFGKPELQTDMEKNVADALEYSQFQYDVIFEEQFREGRQNRYKVLVAAGAASYKNTPKRLGAFVENGGTLVLFYDAVTLDEYGKPNAKNFSGIEFLADKSAVSGDLKIGDNTMKAFHFKSVKMPEEWAAIASIGDEPAIWEKQTGKGKMVFVNAKVAGTDLRVLMSEILKTAGVKKLCKLSNAVSGKPCNAIEMAKGVANGKVGYFFFNRSMEQEAIALTPSEDLQFAEIISHKIIEKDADGKILFALKPSEPAIIVGATPDVAAKIFADYEKVSAQAAKKKIYEWDSLIRADKMKSQRAFDVNAANVRTVGMREFANWNCNTNIPSNNEKSKLKSVPWTIENCNGVPFDFIRPDHNKNLTAIGLGNFGDGQNATEVLGVKIDSKIAAVYFMHAAAGDAKGEVMRYIVNYSDGSKIEIPVVMGNNIGAWDSVIAPDKNAETVSGFISPDNRGLYIWKWENPFPYKLVKTIDARLTRPNALTITTGITIESPSGDSDFDFVQLAGLPESIEFVNCKDGTFANGAVEMKSSKMENFARFTFKLDKKYALAKNAPEGSFAFDVDVGADGKLPLLCVALDTSLNKMSYSSQYMFINLGGGKYRAQIPLNMLLEDEHDGFENIAVQLHSAANEFESIKIDNFSIIAYRSKNPFRYDSVDLSQWGGVNPSKGRNYIAFDLDNKSNKWCVAGMKLLRPTKVPENLLSKTLSFKVNAGPDTLGNRNIGKQSFQITISFRNKDGKVVDSNTVVLSKKTNFISGKTIDTKPATWQNVSIPMARMLGKKAAEVETITGISFQYRMMPADRAGIWVKDVKIE